MADTTERCEACRRDRPANEVWDGLCVECHGKQERGELILPAQPMPEGLAVTEILVVMAGDPRNANLDQAVTGSILAQLIDTDHLEDTDYYGPGGHHRVPAGAVLTFADVAWLLTEPADSDLEEI